MNTRFDTCLQFILRPDIEGGKVDDPEDHGGRTAYGITQATYDAFTGSTADVWGITQAEVAAIYHTRYWDACQCDLMPVGLDLAMFDSAIQHGPGNAVRFLQRGLGVPVDGALGPTTLGEMREFVAEGLAQNLVANYLGERKQFYASIIEHDPTQSKWAHGWANRLDKLTAAVGAQHG